MKEDKASSTAYTVVHGILHTAKNPALRFLVSDETVQACEKILAASPEGQKRLAQLASPVKSRLLPFLEWLLLPGITLNYVLRKKFIAENVIQGVAYGATQVVNIGAGFDTLAWRLSKKLPLVNFIEIDHPATGREKIKALCNETVVAKNLHFLAADLSKQSLESVLNGFAGFDPRRKTIYLCEGVLMYLEEEHVIGLFDALKKLTGAGSTFIFSCMEPNESEKNNIRPLLHLYLTLKNERYNWYIRERDLPDFLTKRDYSLKAVADSKFYRNNYLREGFKGAVHRGEFVAVAEAL